jgi:cytoskeleton protein RodZ
MAPTIGQHLKQAREKRGMSLLQLSKATNIRLHYLEALENDQRKALPSNVQGRGFLRLYAGAVGLPFEPLLAAWDGKAPLEEALAAYAAENAPADPAGAPGVDIAAPDGADAEPQTGPAPADLAAVEPAAAPPASTVPGVFGASSGTPVAGAGEPAPASATTAPALSSPLPMEPDDNGAPTAQSVMRAIGRDLRRQREALGLTLVEVERYTRLRQHYIEALEDGRLEGMPSPVQGRGMLSNYAAFLNMDEEQILMRFAEVLQLRRVERLPSPEPVNVLPGKAKKRPPVRQASLLKRVLTPDLVFGVGIGAVFLFFALWAGARVINQQDRALEPTTPPIAAVLLTQQAMQTSQPSAIDLTAIAGEDAGTGAGLILDGETEGTPAEDDTTAVGGQAGDTPVPTATMAPFSNDPLQVYIIARQRAYLRVVVDGKEAFNGRAMRGNAYAYSGKNQIEVVTGNAAALQVFFNQNEFGSLGGTGEVVRLLFEPSGIITPTPAFTASPTVTPLATMTPLPTSTPEATPSITPFVP